jgi:RimJ/RimL family protein N-acetyltransferase
MHPLPREDYSRVRPLLRSLAQYHVSIDGVLAGHNPGVVYVDNLSGPQVALLIGPEGTYLGGATPTAEQVRALRQLLADLMHNADLDALWLDCDAGWDAHLPDMLPWPPLEQARQHYVCTHLAWDWRTHVPAGFTVLPITADLLNRPDLDVPDHIHEWIENNWGSTGQFLAHGFGLVTVDEAQRRVVSWSLCDCNGGDACEIGIHTHPDYRRRGLAALTTAAAVDHALTHGFQSVGWHCHAENTGSRRTALKVGFAWERDYVHRVCLRSEAIHWAEGGRMAEVRGDYRAAADLYVRAAAASDQPDWRAHIPYFAACMFAQIEDYPAAWEWLHRAAALGFADQERLQANAVFDPLKSTVEWTALLETISQKKS